MTTSIIGFPRVGEHRELKFALESYWKGKSGLSDLTAVAAELKKKHWKLQAETGLGLISAGDFSYFDGLLDTANLLNIVPERYRALGLAPLDEYFAQARGLQTDEISVKALPMKKWFNTNYHYIVPEIEDETEIRLSNLAEELLKDAASASEFGTVKLGLIGPFTLLKLSHFAGKKRAADFAGAVTAAYSEFFDKLNAFSDSSDNSDNKVAWLQLDEPALVFDLTAKDQALFHAIYEPLLAVQRDFKVNLQTYFGDVRDIYEDLIQLPFDGLGIDFLEGKESQALLQKFGFPADKTLFAGVINGKNIWKNDYTKTLRLLDSLPLTDNQLILSTSCSLLHVPFNAQAEVALPENLQTHLSYAVEKLAELQELAAVKFDNNTILLEKNQALHQQISHPTDASVQKRLSALTEADFIRLPAREAREKLQKSKFKLPVLPTTTIGSFPQTPDVRKNRARLRKDEIDLAEYDNFNREKIARIVKWQEDAGFDVLVHGEYERNDMVEYFGEQLVGFEFTQNGWVQSYGSRCVKPPIIWGDVSRKGGITVDWSVYAQSLTKKPMKGMLTGPVTIYNWSFAREDISAEASVKQIALAIEDEVLDLEAHGIRIIQIDEAALREKLPLRQSDWYSQYLDWAIPAFRLVHSKVAPETQIHTHMCYSEFNSIVQAIDAMDADVISFEASRSDLTVIDALKAEHFETEVGPGVYDIHSPRVPSVEEIEEIIKAILAKLPEDKVWINPDCGLKTRGEAETFESLANLIAATQQIRKAYENK